MCAAESRRLRLGELLLQAGVITEEQLRVALEEQKKWGGKLGTLLVEMHSLDEDMLVKALSKQLNLPRVDFNGLVIPQQALDKLESDFAEDRQILPIAYDVAKNLLIVAMCDPSQLELVDEVAFRSGCRVKVAIAATRPLAHAIRENYFGDNIPDSMMGGAGQIEFVDSLGHSVNASEQAQRGASDAAVAQEPQPAPAASPEPAPVASPVSTADKLQQVGELQAREVRILKTMVELVIKKGFITQDEYRQSVKS